MRKLKKNELKPKRSQISTEAYKKSATQIRDNINMETFSSNSSQMSTELRILEGNMAAMIREIKFEGN